MTSCLKIDQCIQCDYRIEENCSKCSGNHTLNTESNSCECKTNPACKKSEVCVSLTGQCLNAQLCTKNPFCKSCSDIEPDRCKNCIQGFQLSSIDQCDKMPCFEVKNCQSCDFQDNTKCEQCLGSYIINNNFCECGAGSQTDCLTDETCTSKGQCVKKISCLKVDLCVKCQLASPDKCEICENGFEASRDGKSCTFSYCDDQNCLVCPEKKNCQRCQPNLTYSLSNFKCECVPGSKKACDPGLECSREDHVCIPKTACLSLIQDCELCWYHDTRLCEICKAGYIISSDRKLCIPLDSCKTISGCSKCVDFVPNLCEVCEGQIEDFGRKCSNKNLSSGAVAGIIIGVLVVIACVIIAVLYIIKRICQKKKIGVFDTPKKDLPGQYLQ